MEKHRYKYGPIIVMQKQRIQWLLALGFLFLGLPSQVQAQEPPQRTRLTPARNPEQVPTARYGRGEAVDLSLIVEEWRDRYPAIAIYACSCRADTCGDTSIWPYRAFSQYQSFVALGAQNAASNEENGFNCFDMESGERP
ncbi:MAG: hypothetical protein ACFB16_27040 [Phormidesmis sp.]